MLFISSFAILTHETSLKASSKDMAIRAHAAGVTLVNEVFRSAGRMSERKLGKRSVTEMPPNFN